MEITQARYTLVRDYLIAQIMIDNANRSRVVAFMTVQEFRRAKMEGDRYVVKVLEHKTVDTHGPAQVVLTVHLYNCLNIFLKEMRSKLPGRKWKESSHCSFHGRGTNYSQARSPLRLDQYLRKLEWRVEYTIHCIRVRAGGAAAPPPKFWTIQIFWAAREIWAKPVFKDVFKFFIEIDRYFLFLPEFKNGKPVKFTRESGCLARDELLVISKGGHKLIYIFLFFVFVLGHCTVLYCTVLYRTALAGVVN